jgi:hypothetical protein
MPALPTPRGRISSQVLSALHAAAHDLPELTLETISDPLADDDLQLALYCCYELHYRGFDGVDEAWEWHPSLLALRARLEAVFESAIVGAIGAPSDTAEEGEMDLALRAIAEAQEGPPLSRYIERHATREQLLEFVIHRSAYQLKEADPHSFGLPRIDGPAKAAMVEIQADEYGGGRADRMHAALFAKTMRALDLDDTYGAYLDRIPGVTLATVNLISLFGLHRRLRGALIGHLALFEMTSSVPNGRYARGLRRIEAPDAALDFFDEHVVADAVHENIAANDLAGGLARQEPQLAADVLWGARALAEFDSRAASFLLEAWERGDSALLTAPAAALAA